MTRVADPDGADPDPTPEKTRIHPTFDKLGSGSDHPENRFHPNINKHKGSGSDPRKKQYPTEHR